MFSEGENDRDLVAVAKRVQFALLHFNRQYYYRIKNSNFKWIFQKIDI